MPASPTGGPENNAKDEPRSALNNSQGEIWHVETFDTVESHEVEAAVTSEGSRERTSPRGDVENMTPGVTTLSDGDDDENDDVEQPTSASRPLSSKVLAPRGDEEEEDDGEDTPLMSDFSLQLIYNSVFAVFGTVLRIYFGRFFGLDCQDAASANGVDDWLTVISKHVCVTANGRTSQTGGALFTDLPSNFIGSFFMGLISPGVLHGSSHPHPIAWLRQDHPLQTHPAFSMALKVGFCGCLTTFASWNTQMVVMLDGTDTFLGSQVVAALCGYLVGLSMSVAAFVFGRHVHHAWCRIHPSHIQVPHDSLDSAVVVAAPDDAIMEQGGDGLEGTEVDAVPVVSPEESPSLDASCGVDKKPQLVNLLPGSVVNVWNTLLGIRVLPFVLLTGITSGFVVGDVVYGSLFYRNMWMCVVLSPFGALLRWYLAHKYNEVSQEETPLRIKGYRLDWVPWGTVFANMFAVVISVVAQALQGHVGAPGSPEVAWSLPFLLAVESGFSGSLSTVSTFVHELVDLHETPTRMHLYGFGSLAAAMFLGLLVYCPLIRYL